MAILLNVKTPQEEPPMDTQTPINWTQSRTIIAAFVSALSGVLALSGHVIDDGVQQQIVNAIIDALNVVAIVSALVAAYYRTKATAVIKPVSAPTVK